MTGGWKKSWVWAGAVLIALAVCPVAKAEGDRAQRAPVAASPSVVQADEDAAAPEPSPAATAEPVAVAAAGADAVGGAVYNPFSETSPSRPDRRATAAEPGATKPREADATMAILAAVAGIAALGYLLRRALNGF